MVALAAVLLATTPAHAQSKLDRAKKHFEQGEAYFRAKTYDRAIDEYQKAYDLVQKPGLLFNIGLAHEYAGNAEEAVAMYQQYIAAEPEGAKAPEARARMESLSRQLLEQQKADEKAKQHRRNAVRLADSGDLTGAVAELRAAWDIRPQPELLYEIAELLRQKGDRDEAIREYQRYLSIEGAKVHRVEAARAVEELKAEQAKGDGDHEPPPDGPPPPTGPVDGQPRPSLLPAAIAFGAAGVFVAAGVGFGVKSNGTRSDLEDELDTGTPPLDSGDPGFDDGKRDALIADVSWALAGAAVITGTVLTIRALRSPEKNSAVSIAPSVGPKHAGVGLEVRW